MHVAKFDKSACGQMFLHYNRNHGEERNYSNESIDKSRTHENYNLAPSREVDEMTFMNNRIMEVKHLNRKDVITMIDTVITLPKDFKGNPEDFFRESYNVCCSLYGEQNIISAYVHMDERTPHMHCSSIPIVKTVDKHGQEIEKLCCNDLVTRQFLRELHPLMERELSERLHEPVHMLNENTREGNKSIEELKRGTAIQQMKEINKEIEDSRDRLEVTRSTLETVDKELTAKREHLEELSKQPHRLPEPQKRLGGTFYRAEDVQAFIERSAASERQANERADKAERQAQQMATVARDETARADRLQERLDHLQEKQWDKAYIVERYAEIVRVEEHQREQEPEHERTRHHDIDR